MKTMSEAISEAIDVAILIAFAAASIGSFVLAIVAYS
jgi:hypothetical protein